jgi:hypothetical protein
VAVAEAEVNRVVMMEEMAVLVVVVVKIMMEVLQHKQPPVVVQDTETMAGIVDQVLEAVGVDQTL